ncbi:hypothetical protein POX_b01998 [Penicillium oxalicum]|uniref:hypothetical protein n=1 Tax=Penicillium oxalicum TaxID=69781 RepID=UPI0020B8D472|nr:hypothetical protein POX_b01998 [Penicillium oxalicum]KAI2791969.1 hypothetical protein POX_b01998 [Penicillium oxalicum]
MSANDPFSFVAAEQPKPVKEKKANWRGKLFSKEKKDRPAADQQQIEDFLASNRPVTETVSSPKADSRDARPVISTRQIPSLNGVPQSPVSSMQSPSTDDYAAFDFKQTTSPSVRGGYFSRESSQQQLSHPKTKNILNPRKGKGLHVEFCKLAPELIGEGGDETDAPTIEISRTRQRHHERVASEQPAPSVSSHSPDAQSSYLPALTVDTSLGNFERQTVANPDAAWRPPLIQNPLDSEFLSTLQAQKPGSRLSFRGSADAHSLAERVRDQMQAEEARALQQHRAEDDLLSPADEKSDIGSPDLPPAYSSQSPSISSHAVSPQLTSSSSILSTTHQIQNINSPNESRMSTNLTPSGSMNLSSRTPTLPVDGSTQSPPSASPAPSPATREPLRTAHSSGSNDSASRLATPPGREPARSPQPPKYSLRSLAGQVGELAFKEFQTYIDTYSSQIHQAAQDVKPVEETSLSEWIRAAVWWFLRGRSQLESFARSRNSTPAIHAKQAVINLGKALWINEKVVPGHFELSRYGSISVEAILAVASTTGQRETVELLSAHSTMLNHLRSLSMSIKRNNILADTLRDDGQGSNQLDISVWVRYPFFAADVAAVLSGSASRSMLADAPVRSSSIVSMMPLGDTAHFFTYGSMFVQAYVSSREDEGKQYAMPCVLSITRERSDWYVCTAITSQSALVNVVIQGDRKQGPTWDDVDWDGRNHSLRVKLPRGFELDVLFAEDDFRTLWNIVRYTRNSEASLSPEAGETVVFENTLKAFQYMDPGTPKAFPAEPTERCRIRLFERQVTITEGTGSRNAHRGFRLSVLTSPKVKTMSNVTHRLGDGWPVVFGLLRGEDGSPALLLKVTEDGRTRSMLLTFHEVEERTEMHSVLLSMLPRDGEVATRELPLRSYMIEEPANPASGRSPFTHLQFPGGHASVIDREHTFVDHGYGPTILSEHLRAFVATEWGSVTDRINLGPGDLRLGLDVKRATGMSLFRAPQHDLTISLADNLIRPEMPEQVSEFLRKGTAKPMIRRYEFTTVQDLHAFQEAVTGFKVIYDGIASLFTISRRRMVVPIYKKWEASSARVQIVQQEKIVQLVAFFSDFQHGTCMNFVLKGTDQIESFTRSGKFGIRILDAKFALPKKDEDAASDFVCLDMPEYPIEHDDIGIAFDTEAGRNDFKAVLPGSVREPSRMVSLRR